MVKIFFKTNVFDLLVYLLQNQQLELSNILELKENEITNKYKEINNIRQENNDLKENLKVN